MTIKLIGRLFLSMLFALVALSAQAGIYATVNVTNARHAFNQEPDDGLPAIPYSGTLTSNLINIKQKNSCRAGKRPGAQLSWCRYETDFGGVASPYVDELRSRFQSAQKLTGELAVILEVNSDGSYWGMFSFYEGATETYRDQTGTYYSTLDSDYQFWIEGNNLAPETYVNLDFIKRFWGAGAFTRQTFITSWTLYRITDTGERNGIESEAWYGDIDASTGFVPEPAAPLLFVTGLFALLRQQGAKRRAGFVSRKA